MRIRRILLGAALLLATASVAPIDSAQATSIAPLTTEQLTDASTYIVEGTVERVWVEEDDNGDVWTRALLKVDTVFKGPDAPETLIIDAIGGHSWERVTRMQSQPRFSAQEKVLVFLDVIKFGTRLTPVGLVHGKYTIRRAPGETRHHVMRTPTLPNAAFDARFLAHPAIEDRVYLDDVQEAVRTRVDTGWDGSKIPGASQTLLERVNAPSHRVLREVSR